LHSRKLTIINILSALDNLENPPVEFISVKEKIMSYLKKRMKGEIGGNYTD
jgi:hypothetical protein